MTFRRAKQKATGVPRKGEGDEGGQEERERSSGLFGEISISAGLGTTSPGVPGNKKEKKSEGSTSF